MMAHGGITMICWSYFKLNWKLSLKRKDQLIFNNLMMGIEYLTEGAGASLVEDGTLLQHWTCPPLFMGSGWGMILHKGRPRYHPSRVLNIVELGKPSKPPVTEKVRGLHSRHWQESRSREILEEKWFRFFSLAREKLIFMSRSPLDFQESEEKFLFLLSIFKTWK